MHQGFKIIIRRKLIFKNTRLNQINIFGDPINLELLEKQSDRIEIIVKELRGELKIIASLLLSMKEDATNAQIKEIRSLVRNLFYEIKYVYYYTIRNWKPDDQPKIKKLLDSKLEHLSREPTGKSVNSISKNECAVSILSEM